MAVRERLNCGRISSSDKAIEIQINIKMHPLVVTKIVAAGGCIFQLVMLAAIPENR